jgi:hypothetical protein
MRAVETILGESNSSYMTPALAFEILTSAKHRHQNVWRAHGGYTFDELEDIIAKDPIYSLALAMRRKKPFPKGEDAISSDLESSYGYAYNVLHDEFPLGEPLIAKSGTYSYYYAKNVLHDRFLMGEEAVSKSRRAGEYLREFPEAKMDWVVNGWLDWLDL